MSFALPRKLLPQNMSTIAAAICRIPNARLSIPAAINVSARTVENWLQGSAKPSADHLIAMMREFDCVTEEVLRLAGKRTITDAQMEAARKALKILDGS